MQLLIVLVALCVIQALAFRPLGQSARRVSTELYEDFKLGGKPTITSAPQIFSEKQLREFTATYSSDERWNPFEALGGLFAKKEGGAPTSDAPSSVKSALKPTISLAVLEEKTSQFVEGKINADAFLKVLKAAFGPKLDTVFPEIVSNLPAAKAKALAAAKK